MDKKQFTELLKSVHTLYSKEFNPSIAMLWWNIFSEHDFSEFKTALNQHIKTSRFFPTPADVIAALPDRSGHPAPEQAWNALPKTEHEGGYVTGQMMAAMSACMDSLERGDYIGGRMAFIEAYKRIIEKAKQENTPARFWYSAPTLGGYEHKQQLKQQHIMIARDNGWLDGTHAANLLSQLSPNSNGGLPQLLERAKEKNKLLTNGTNQTNSTSLKIVSNPSTDKSREANA